MHYAYYEKNTGKLVSTGTIPSETTPDHLIRKEYPNGFPENKIWNEVTKDFDIDRPRTKRVTRQEYLLLFTGQERTAIRNAAKTDQNVDDLLFMTQNAEVLDIFDPFVQTELSYLVAQGLITHERREEIENG